MGMTAVNQLRTIFLSKTIKRRLPLHCRRISLGYIPITVRDTPSVCNRFLSILSVIVWLFCTITRDGEAQNNIFLSSNYGLNKKTNEIHYTAHKQKGKLLPTN